MNATSDFFPENGMSSAGGDREQHREGPVARRIEQHTAKVPSDVFLWAAGAAIIGSLAVQIVGLGRGQRRELMGGIFGHEPKMSAPLASFIGQWVPSLLLLGVYNKIVKVAGSDRMGR